MPNIDTLAVLSAQPLDTGDAITASAASGAVYDATINRNLGLGEAIKVVANCTVAFTDGSSDSTVVVTLQTSDDNSSYADVQTIGTFAALTAIGTKLEAFLQPGAIIKRYIRAYYTVANGNLTTGSVAVFFTDAFDDQTAYAVGTTIK
jgi:hypothetical protein